MSLRKRRIIAWLLFFTMLFTNVFSQSEKTYANEQNSEYSENTENEGSYETGESSSEVTNEENNNGDDSEADENGSENSGGTDENNSGEDTEDPDENENIDDEENDENDENGNEMLEEDPEEEEDLLEKEAKEQEKNKLHLMMADTVVQFDADMIDLVLRADKLSLASGEKTSIILDLSFSTLEEEGGIFEGMEFRVNLPDGIRYESTQNFVAFDVQYVESENYVSFTALQEFTDGSMISLPFQVYYPGGITSERTAEFTVALFDRDGNTLNHYYPAMPICTLEISSDYGWTTRTSVSGSAQYAEQPETGTTVTVDSAIGFTFRADNSKWQELGSSVGLLHTKEINLVGRIYAPSFITLDDVTITSSPTAELKLVDTVSLNPRTIVSNNIVDEAIPYNVYEVYDDAERGLTQANGNIEEEDIEYFTYTVKINSHTLDLSQAPRLDNNTYAYTALIIADNETSYTVYDGATEEEPIVSGKSTSLTGIYNQRHFIQYVQGTKSGFGKTTATTATEKSPFNAQDTSTTFSFNLTTFSNPLTEKESNTKMLYYYPENLYNFVVEDSRTITNESYAQANIWNYASVHSVSTGVYDIYDGIATSLSIKEQYEDLTFEIQYELNDNTWHSLGVFDVFTATNGTIARRTNDLVDLSALNTTDKITGVRYIFSDDMNGLPPGFKIVTNPQLHFNMNVDAATAITFTANGLFETYNSAALTYNRAKLDSDGKEILSGGKPELTDDEVKIKVSASFVLSEREFIYVSKNKTAKNVSGGHDLDSIYMEGDTVEYTLKITNQTTSKRNLTLEHFVVTDYPDPKLLGVFDDALDYKVTLGGQDVTALTTLKVTQGTKPGGTDIHPILTFTFKDGAEEYLAPGKSLLITYRITIPELAGFESGSINLTNQFFFIYDDTHEHTTGGYCPDCGIKEDGNGNCTITVWKRVPGLGIRKRFSLGNQSLLTVGSTVNVIVEAKHFGDKFENNGDSLYAVIQDTLTNKGFAFDAEGQQLFDDTFKVYANGTLIPSDEYSLYKIGIDNTATIPCYSVMIPAEYFDSGDMITINYSLKVGPEGNGNGEVTFGNALFTSYTHYARLAIYNSNTDSFLDKNGFFTDIGNWGTARGNAGMYHYNAEGKPFYTMADNVTASSTITVTKEPHKLGLIKTQTNINPDVEAGKYSIDYQVKVQSFNETNAFNIPAGSVYIIDILPEGQTISDNATLVRYYASGNPYTNNANKFAVTVEELGYLEGRQIVKIATTSQMPLAAGEYMIFSFSAEGDYSVFQSANTRLQNWVAFKPDIPFAKTEEPGYGYIDSIELSNPYMYPDTNDTNKMFYLKNFCEIDIEQLLIEPALSVNLLKFNSNDVYTTKDKMDVYPGTSVSWRIKVDNVDSASAAMSNFKLVAALPGGFETNASSFKIWDYDTNNWTSFSGHGTVDNIVTKADGRQYVTLTVTDAIEPGGPSILIKYDTAIPVDFYGGDFSYAYLIPNESQSWWEESVKSGTYLDEDKSLEILGASVRAISAFSNINVYGAFAIQSNMTVANADGSNVVSNSYDTLKSSFGQQITYTMSIESSGDYSFQDLVMINVFPYVGDTGVKLTKQARKSEWAPTDIENVVVYLNGVALQSPSGAAPGGFFGIMSASADAPTAEVRYSDKQMAAAGDWAATSADGTWDQTPTENTKSMRIFISGDALTPQDKIEVSFNMTTPDGVNMESGTAWNSFAFETLPYKAGASEASRLRAEPTKVGVELITGKLTIEKSIKDASGNTVNKTFTFKVEPIDSVMDTFNIKVEGAGATTVDIMPGTYKISELAIGGYTLEGFNHTSNKTVTITIDDYETVVVNALNSKNTDEEDDNNGGGGNEGGGGGNNGGGSSGGGNNGGGGSATLDPATTTTPTFSDNAPTMILDDDNVPLGHIDIPDEEEMFLNLDPDDIPLGSISTDKQNPKTGDYSKPTYWVMAACLGYIVLSYLLALKSQKNYKVR